MGPPNLSRESQAQPGTGNIHFLSFVVEPAVIIKSASKARAFFVLKTAETQQRNIPTKGLVSSIVSDLCLNRKGQNHRILFPAEVRIYLVAALETTAADKTV